MCFKGNAKVPIHISLVLLKSGLAAYDYVGTGLHRYKRHLMSSMGRLLALRLQHARIRCKHRTLCIYERIPCTRILISSEQPLTKASPECLPSKLLLPSAHVCIIKNVNDFLSTANAKRVQSWWMHTFISMCAKQRRVVLTKVMIGMHKIDNLPIWQINLGPSSFVRKYINPTHCNA